MEVRLFVFGFELESRKHLIVSQCSMGIALCFLTDTDHKTQTRSLIALNSMRYALCFKLGGQKDGSKNQKPGFDLNEAGFFYFLKTLKT